MQFLSYLAMIFKIFFLDTQNTWTLIFLKKHVNTIPTEVRETDFLQ